MPLPISVCATSHPPAEERARIPIPWNPPQLVYYFAVVPLAASAVAEDESSSSWASCVFCRRPLAQRTPDSEECAKPPVWTRHAFQMPSTRPPSVVADSFVQTTVIAPNPGEDSLDDMCLLSIRLKSGFASALANRDIPVSEWSTGHDIHGATLCVMPLTAPTTFHEFGSLIFSNDALHLEQQVVFRALTERPVQEDKARH